MVKFHSGTPFRRPLRTRPRAVYFFCGPQDRGDLPSAACVYFMSLSRQNAASESERTAALSDRKSTSQSALLTAPLSGEPYAPRSGRFFYEPRVVIRYPTPVGATTWGARYALRFSRSVVVILSLSPHSSIRRGRPGKASRYALRVSRSGVVILSLSRRNAASESEATCGPPFGRPLRILYHKLHWQMVKYVLYLF